MEQEYRVLKGTKIFYSIAASVMFILALFMLALTPAAAGFPRVLLSSIFLALAILFLSKFYLRKLTVSEYSIVYTTLFSTKELPGDGIKGYRTNGKNISIEPLPGKASRINIFLYAELEKSDELLAWIKNNYKDLNALSLANEQQLLLQDTALGDSEKERIKKLKLIKAEALWYNIAGAVLGFVLVFVNSIWSNLILLAFPLSGILMISASRGATKFLSNSKKSVCNYIAVGFTVPCFGLLVKSTIAYKLLQADHLWLPALLATGFVFALLLSKGINRLMGIIKIQVLLILAASLMYGFACVRTINGAFDDSTATTYGATVLQRRITKGDDKSYFLTLSPWGPSLTIKEIAVDRQFYKRIQTGDTVLVKLKPGLLHIPWFTVLKR